MLTFLRDLLLQFCGINNLTISNTVYQHSKKRRATWLSPDCKTFNQIDYIIVQNKWKDHVYNSRAYHSADVGSYHFLDLANIMFDVKKSKIIPRV